jgi:Pyruvate/2-oxoacid:ferredoxin oxidoreductase gamma subunit
MALSASDIDRNPFKSNGYTLAQGDIDIAIASEIAEAGRMVQRGFVTPERTTLIASDHRVYGITEKEHLGDGIVDASVLQAVAGRYARDYIHYDMLSLANEHGTVISAVLLGALAGAGVLPFAKDSYRTVISATGKAVASNLAAFEASYQRASSRGVEQFQPAAAAPLEPAKSLLLAVLGKPECCLRLEVVRFAAAMAGTRCEVRAVEESRRARSAAPRV